MAKPDVNLDTVIYMADLVLVAVYPIVYFSVNYVTYTISIVLGSIPPLSTSRN